MSELPTNLHTYYYRVVGTEGRVPLILEDQIDYAHGTESLRDIFVDEEFPLGRKPEAAGIYLNGLSLKLGCTTEAIIDSVPVSKLVPKNPDDVYNFEVPSKNPGDGENQVKITRTDSDGQVFNDRRKYSVKNLLIATGLPIATDWRIKRPRTEIASISENVSEGGEEVYDRVVLLPYPSFDNYGSGPLKKIRYIPVPESMLPELRDNLLRWINEDPTLKTPTSGTGAVESAQDTYTYTLEPESPLSGGDGFFGGVRKKVVYLGGGKLVRSEDILGRDPELIRQNEDGTYTLNIPVYSGEYTDENPIFSGLTVTSAQFSQLSQIAVTNRHRG